MMMMSTKKIMIVQNGCAGRKMNWRTMFKLAKAMPAQRAASDARKTPNAVASWATPKKIRKPAEGLQVGEDELDAADKDRRVVDGGDAGHEVEHADDGEHDAREHDPALAGIDVVARVVA